MSSRVSEKNVHLNACRRATGFHLGGIGELDPVLTHAREIFRTAIVRTASAVVIAPSHPSGHLDPTVTWRDG